MSCFHCTRSLLPFAHSCPLAKYFACTYTCLPSLCSHLVGLLSLRSSLFSVNERLKQDEPKVLLIIWVFCVFALLLVFSLLLCVPFIRLLIPFLVLCCVFSISLALLSAAPLFYLHYHNMRAYEERERKRELHALLPLPLLLRTTRRI